MNNPGAFLVALALLHWDERRRARKERRRR